MKKHYRISVQGCVQGVGFRPYVYRLANQLQISGFVNNDGNGVKIEILTADIQKFCDELKNNAPPLARIDAIDYATISHFSYDCSQEFKIIDSVKGSSKTIISPDVAICNDCLNELFDPNSRFYLYPFLNCMHCGPRLSITRELPYDRSNTALEPFLLCTSCDADYHNPGNRRYHAQPTACVQCGPVLSQDIEQLVEKIKQGQIVALKGVGGYQLICDARNFTSLQTLRSNKNRKTKPFAVMVLNEKSAELIVHLNLDDRENIQKRERPIVLSETKHQLPDIIAPGLNKIGVMLPYSPLHYLIFYYWLKCPKDLDWLNQSHDIVLVVTSANPGGIPLIVDDQVAHQELQKITNVVVSYNREIVTRIDDSVIQYAKGKRIFVRRARGFVPTPIELAQETPCILALGAHLKNTVCLTRGKEAFVSQHIGDMENRETIQFWHETIHYWLKFLNIQPEMIVRDAHPDFYASQWADSWNKPVVVMQHHFAHALSVIAEHHVQEPVLALILDGYGYGERGEAWGGELLEIRDHVRRRVGHLASIPLLGGDQAAREGWRVAAGILIELGEINEAHKRFAHHSQFYSLILGMKNLQTISRTTSCGRLFDAASAILGVAEQSYYEGEAAMRLESLVTAPVTLPNGWSIQDGILDFSQLLRKLLMCTQSEGANIFHGTLVQGLALWVQQTALLSGIKSIVLNGGCFLNAVLLEGLSDFLREQGLNVYSAQQLPSHDGGICLGQVQGAWAIYG